MTLNVPFTTVLVLYPLKKSQDKELEELLNWYQNEQSKARPHGFKCLQILGYYTIQNSNIQFYIILFKQKTEGRATLPPIAHLINQNMNVSMLILVGQESELNFPMETASLFLSTRFPTP